MKEVWSWILTLVWPQKEKRTDDVIEIRQEDNLEQWLTVLVVNITALTG